MTNIFNTPDLKSIKVKSLRAGLLPINGRYIAGGEERDIKDLGFNIETFEEYFTQRTGFKSMVAAHSVILIPITNKPVKEEVEEIVEDITEEKIEGIYIEIPEEPEEDMEALIGYKEPEELPENLDRLTKKELVAVGDDRGIDLNTDMTKKEIIAALTGEEG